jgi:hypothetical protein
MEPGTDPEAPPEVGPGILLSGEVVAHHWSAPQGRGLLTNLRCLLLGHPHPLHRSLRWSVDLERVNSLSVEPIRGLGGTHVAFRGFYGGTLTTGSIDPTFGVLVNDVAVYIGDAAACGDLQRWLDDARTSRCLALFGRLLPYGSAASAKVADAPMTPVGEAADLAPAAPPDGLGAPFVLFLAGEPFKDAVPGARSPALLGYFLPGGTGIWDTIGGHEPADNRPGQIYGAQAEMGRMVLDLASGYGVSVKVVDVNRSGQDAALVQRYVLPDDELPVLIRTDGARLAGSDSFVPDRVKEFLLGR